MNAVREFGVRRLGDRYGEIRHLGVVFVKRYTASGREEMIRVKTLAHLEEFAPNHDERVLSADKLDRIVFWTVADEVRADLIMLRPLQRRERRPKPKYRRASVSV